MQHSFKEGLIPPTWAAHNEIHSFHLDPVIFSHYSDQANVSLRHYSSYRMTL
jgi:hypothetical protein